MDPSRENTLRSWRMSHALHSPSSKIISRWWHGCDDREAWFLISLHDFMLISTRFLPVSDHGIVSRKSGYLTIASANTTHQIHIFIRGIAAGVIPIRRTSEPVTSEPVSTGSCWRPPRHCSNDLLHVDWSSTSSELIVLLQSAEVGAP